MRAACRILAMLACLSVIAQAIWLNRATGGRVFTAFPHPDLAQMKAHEGEMSALFHDATLDGPEVVKDPISNDFALGWLPSGWGRHTISVLTISTPALFTLGLLITLKPRRAITPVDRS